MSAEIISQSGSELTIEVKVSLKESMLESEQSILDCVNEVGTLVTGEALKQFDADGKPIVVGEVKFTSRCESEKELSNALRCCPYRTSRLPNIEGRESLYPVRVRSENHSRGDATICQNTDTQIFEFIGPERHRGSG